jgi:chemotaxis protein CheD
MGESLMVGMAEVKVTKSPDAVLMALGLGSCVGICAYDAQARVAGLAHVVLPESIGQENSPGKFANTAVPFLLQEMRNLGASPIRIRVALAGGAQLFAASGGAKLEIGLRNAAAVTAALKQHNIVVVATDLGGTVGRTVQMDASGFVRVKTIGQGERELAALGGQGASVPKPPVAPTEQAEGARSRILSTPGASRI